MVSVSVQGTHALQTRHVMRRMIYAVRILAMMVLAMTEKTAITAAKMRGVIASVGPGAAETAVTASKVSAMEVVIPKKMVRIVLTAHHRIAAATVCAMVRKTAKTVPLIVGSPLSRKQIVQMASIMMVMAGLTVMIRIVTVIPHARASATREKYPVPPMTSAVQAGVFGVLVNSQIVF